MTGADIAHIPYKGAAPAVADVMGGHVAMTFVPIAAAVPPVRANRLRALAVTGIRRSPTLPDVPTIDESGVSGYEATSWNALLAPVPRRANWTRINAALVESLHAVKVRTIITSAGADAVGSSPEQLASFLNEEIVKWGKVVKAANISPE